MYQYLCILIGHDHMGSIVSCFVVFSHREIPLAIVNTHTRHRYYCKRNRKIKLFIMALLMAGFRSLTPHCINLVQQKLNILSTIFVKKIYKIIKYDCYNLVWNVLHFETKLNCNVIFQITRFLLQMINKSVRLNK